MKAKQVKSVSTPKTVVEAVAAKIAAKVDNKLAGGNVKINSKGRMVMAAKVDSKPLKPLAVAAVAKVDGKAAKPVKGKVAVAAAVKSAKAVKAAPKPKKLIGRLYSHFCETVPASAMVFTGTVNLCNCRLGDYTAQAVGVASAVKGERYDAALFVNGVHGTTVSFVLAVKGTTLIHCPGDRTFDVSGLKSYSLVPRNQAANHIRKNGKPHVIRLAGEDRTGHLLGKDGSSYQAFAAKDGTVSSPEFFRCSDGRNKARFASMVK